MEVKLRYRGREIRAQDVAFINALMDDPAEKGNVNPEVLKYVNRLSDLLFVLARAMNDGGKADVLWVPAARKDEPAQD